jgi:hypothetical protein
MCRLQHRKQIWWQIALLRDREAPLRRGGRRQAEKTGGRIHLRSPLPAWFKIRILADFELWSFFCEKTPPKAW